MLDGKPAKNRFQIGAKYSNRGLTKGEAVIKMVSSVAGQTFVTFEYESRPSRGGSRRGIATYNEGDFLYYYKEVEDFFVSGGEYKIGESTAYVKEIYTISNPVTASYRKQARAIIINADGKRYMEMLDGYSFGGAKRIR